MVLFFSNVRSRTPFCLSSWARRERIEFSEEAIVNKNKNEREKKKEKKISKKEERKKQRKKKGNKK